MMPIFVVIAFGVVSGFVGYMFGKASKDKDLSVEKMSRGKSLGVPSLTPPTTPEVKAAVAEAAKETKKAEVKAVAKEALTTLLEGRTIRTKKGDLLKFEKGSEEGLWNLVEAKENGAVSATDLSYEDIKGMIDSGDYTLT